MSEFTSPVTRRTYLQVDGRKYRLSRRSTGRDTVEVECQYSSGGSYWKRAGAAMVRRVQWALLERGSWAPPDLGDEKFLNSRHEKADGGQKKDPDGHPGSRGRQSDAGRTFGVSLLVTDVGAAIDWAATRKGFRYR